MAEADASPATVEPNQQPPLDQNPSNLVDPEAPSSTPPPSATIAPQPSPNPSYTPALVPPGPVPPPIAFVPPPTAPPSAPSFRPVAQFSILPQNPIFPNPSLQNHGIQPPGVGSVAPASVGVGVGPGVVPMLAYQNPNQVLRPPFAAMPNGYAAIPGSVPQGAMQIPGLPRYPSPYPTMVRPGFPTRPLGAIGMLPRPPIPGMPIVRPMIHPFVRPVMLPIVTPAEKPQTTVYVGKISPTVENEFILSLLEYCGSVKSWKRAQDPSNGTPRGFGFCEFESAEGVLRALRLLSKFSIDGQELVLNVNQATRDYLEKYVEKRTENAKKLKETEAEAAAKDDEGSEKTELPKPVAEEPKEENDSENKESDNSNFGIVTDEDREADKEAMEKLTSMIEERIKTKPLPPPPSRPPPDAKAELSAAKSKDGDSDQDMKTETEDKNDNDSTTENKQAGETDRTETSSPDRNRRHDRRSRERDRERDQKREVERYERETERERVRKEREQRRRVEDADRQYEEFVREWEYREREKEKNRQYEREKEKERERKRKKEIMFEEEDEEDDSRKRWRRSSLDEKRKKRLREKDDDLLDKQKEEEEEIAEAKRRAEEEEILKQQEQEALKNSLDDVMNGTEKVELVEESSSELKSMAMEEDYEGVPDRENHNDVSVLQNGNAHDEPNTVPISASDAQNSGNSTTKKLGFGLLGSGKRTAVLSVFNEEDEDTQKDKKMRPLVPIDYSTEEIQAVQSSASTEAQPNLAAAAEFAKRIANSVVKDEKPEERSKHSKDRNRDDGNRRSETKEKSHDSGHGSEKVKSTDNKKVVEAKQLIDMIPKTKEELFSYQINWAIYDKHALHDRMRPWITKKITEFLGEEEATLVDYIVSSFQEHVEAERMLQLLQSILDEEAEMFVLKMWRMLIFEIKRVESGLPSRSRT